MEQHKSTQSIDHKCLRQWEKNIKLLVDLHRMYEMLMVWNNAAEVPPEEEELSSAEEGEKMWQ